VVNGGVVRRDAERLGWTLLGVATAAIVAAGAACVAHEETTPGGYVIAPSVPADGGFVFDAGTGDASRS
jgi:hypothetical protein